MLDGLLRVLLLVALPAWPPQDGEAAPPTKDQVHLRSGGFVDGAIVEETDALIIVEVLPGARVEFAKADVSRVVRAPRKTESSPASRPTAPTAAAEPPSESWYVVRDASGQLLGTRHVRVGPDSVSGDGIRVEETLELRDEAGSPIRIQRIETAERDLRPRECHYREISDGNSSTVEARFKADVLEIETLDDEGRLRIEVPRAGKLTFPLLFRELVRRTPPKSGESVEWDVFDPFVRTITRRSAKGAEAQKVAIGDEPPRFHNVYVVFARGVQSLAWLAGSGDVAREELNGPDMVATRCTAGEAAAAAKSRPNQGFTARDAAGRIQLMLPSSDWRFDKPASDSVSLSRKDGSATIVACALVAERDVTATGTALLLERRLARELERYQRTGTYEDCVIGKLPAVRFEFRCQESQGTRSGVAIAIRGMNSAAACVMTFDTTEKLMVERELDRLLNRADFRL